MNTRRGWRLAVTRSVVPTGPWLPCGAVLALCVASLFTAPLAKAGVPTPVCRVPTVVEVIAEEVRARWYYASIDPNFIAEEPTADGRLMQCGVCVVIDAYAMAQYGPQPVARCEPHLFSVQAVRNGFVVRYLR